MDLKRIWPLWSGEPSSSLAGEEGRKLSRLARHRVECVQEGNDIGWRWRRKRKRPQVDRSHCISTHTSSNFLNYYYQRRSSNKSSLVERPGRKNRPARLERIARACRESRQTQEVRRIEGEEICCGREMKRHELRIGQIRNWSEWKKGRKNNRAAIMREISLVFLSLALALSLASQHVVPSEAMDGEASEQRQLVRSLSLADEKEDSSRPSYSSFLPVPTKVPVIEVGPVSPTAPRGPEYASDENQLLLQLLQTTGSLQEANQLLDSLINAGGQTTNTPKPFKSAPDYSEVRAALVGGANEEQQAAPGATETASSLVPGKEQYEKHFGLLDEIIEASAKAVSEANYNVHYDDDSTGSQPTVRPILPIDSERAADLLRASKQIENLIKPPAPQSMNDTAAAVGARPTSAKGGEQDIGEDGLSNNESISSLMIRASNPSLKLIANYSHWINHELVPHQPPPAVPLPALLPPSPPPPPLAGAQRRPRPSDTGPARLDAIRFIAAPTLLTTTTTKSVASFADPESGPPEAAAATSSFEPPEEKINLASSTLAPPGHVRSDKTLNSMDSSKSQELAKHVEPSSREHRKEKKSISKPSVAPSKAVHLAKGRNGTQKVSGPHKNGAHKVELVNSMPQWAAPRKNSPAKQDSAGQAGTEAKASKASAGRKHVEGASANQRRRPVESVNLSKRSTTTTEAYVEVSVFAETLPPSTVSEFAGVETDSPSTVRETIASTASPSYSLETYETTSARNSRTSAAPAASESSTKRPQAAASSTTSAARPQSSKRPSGKKSSAKLGGPASANGTFSGKSATKKVNNGKKVLGRPAPAKVKKSQSSSTIGAQSTTTSAPTTTELDLGPASASDSSFTLPSTPQVSNYGPELSTASPPATTSAVTSGQIGEIGFTEESASEPVTRSAKSLNLAHLLLGLTSTTSMRLPGAARAGDTSTWAPPLAASDTVADLAQRQTTKADEPPTTGLLGPAFSTTPYFEHHESTLADFLAPTPDSLLPSTAALDYEPTSPANIQPETPRSSSSSTKWRAIELPLHSHAQSKRRKHRTRLQAPKWLIRPATEFEPEQIYLGHLSNDTKVEPVANMAQVTEPVISHYNQKKFNERPTKQAETAGGGGGGKGLSDTDSVVLDLGRLIANNGVNGNRSQLADSLRRSTVTTSTTSPIMDDTTDYSHTQSILPTTFSGPLIDPSNQPHLDLQTTTPGVSGAATPRPILMRHSDATPALGSNWTSAHRFRAGAPNLNLNGARQQAGANPMRLVPAPDQLALENEHWRAKGAQVARLANDSLLAGRQQQPMAFVSNFTGQQQQKEVRETNGSRFSLASPVINQAGSEPVNEPHGPHNRSHITLGHFGKRLPADQSAGSGSQHYLDIGGEQASARFRQQSGNAPTPILANKYFQPSPSSGHFQDGSGRLAPVGAGGAPGGRTTASLNGPLVNEEASGPADGQASSGGGNFEPVARPEQVDKFLLAPNSKLSPTDAPTTRTASSGAGESQTSTTRASYTSATTLETSTQNAPFTIESQTTRGVEPTETTTSTMATTSAGQILKELVYQEPDSAIRAGSISQAGKSKQEQLPGGRATGSLSLAARGSTASAAIDPEAGAPAGGQMSSGNNFESKLTSLFQYKVANRTTSAPASVVSGQQVADQWAPPSSNSSASSSSSSSYPFEYHTKEPASFESTTSTPQLSAVEQTDTPLERPSKISNTFALAQEEQQEKFLHSANLALEQQAKVSKGNESAAAEEPDEGRQSSFGLYQANHKSRASEQAASDMSGKQMEMEEAPRARADIANRLLRRDKHKASNNSAHQWHKVALAERTFVNSASGASVVSPETSGDDDSSQAQSDLSKATRPRTWSAKDKLDLGQFETGGKGKRSQATAGGQRDKHNEANEASQELEARRRPSVADGALNEAAKGEEEEKRRRNNSIVADSANSASLKKSERGEKDNSNDSDDGGLNSPVTLATISDSQHKHEQQQRKSYLNSVLSKQLSTGSPVTAVPGSQEFLADKSQAENGARGQTRKAGQENEQNEQQLASLSVYVKHLKALAGEDPGGAWASGASSKARATQMKARQRAASTSTSVAPPPEPSPAQRKRRREPPGLPPPIESSPAPSTQAPQANETAPNQASPRAIPTHREHPISAFVKPKISLGNLFARLPQVVGNESGSPVSDSGGSSDARPEWNNEKKNNANQTDGISALPDAETDEPETPVKVLAALDDGEQQQTDSKRLQPAQQLGKTRRELKKSNNYETAGLDSALRPMDYSRTTQPMPSSSVSSEELIDMLVNGSENQRASSLSPLVDEYKTKSLLKTLISLGVPPRGGSLAPATNSNTNNNNNNGALKKVNEQVRPVKMEKLSSGSLRAGTGAQTNSATTKEESNRQQQQATSNLPDWQAVPSSTSTMSTLASTVESQDTSSEPPAPSGGGGLLEQTARTTTIAPPTTTTLAPSGVLQVTSAAGATAKAAAASASNQGQSRWRGPNGEGAQLRPISLDKRRQEPGRVNEDLVAHSSLSGAPTRLGAPEQATSSSKVIFYATADSTVPMRTTISPGPRVTADTDSSQLDLIRIEPSPSSVSVAPPVVGHVSDTRVRESSQLNSSKTFSTIDPLFASENESSRRKMVSGVEQVTNKAQSVLAPGNVQISAPQQPVTTRLIYTSNEGGANLTARTQSPPATTEPQENFTPTYTSLPPHHSVQGTNNNRDDQLVIGGLQISPPTAYKPPLSHPGGEDASAGLPPAAAPKPFGIRPALNQFRNQRHSDLGPVPILDTSSQLGSFQRAAIITIGVCCSLIIFSLLIIAISIRCRSGSSRRPPLGSVSRSIMAEQRRRRDKRKLAAAAEKARARSKSGGGGKEKSISRNNLLLASEFSTDGQLGSSADSTSSACMSTSSDGLNFMKVTDKRRGVFEAPKGSRHHHQVAQPVMDLLEPGSRRDRQQVLSKRSHNNQAQLQQQQQQPQLPKRSSKAQGGDVGARQHQAQVNLSSTEPDGLRNGGSTLRRISGTITSRLLRMHLPRLLPYFALDYAREQQQVAESFVQQQQQQQLHNANLLTTANNQQQQVGSKTVASRPTTLADLLKRANEGFGSSTTGPASRVASGNFHPPATYLGAPGKKNMLRLDQVAGLSQALPQNFHLRSTGTVDKLQPKYSNIPLLSQALRSNEPIPGARKLQNLAGQHPQHAAHQPHSRSAGNCLHCCTNCSNSAWSFREAHPTHGPASGQAPHGGPGSHYSAALATSRSGGKLPFGAGSSVLCQPGHSGGESFGTQEASAKKLTNHPIPYLTTPGAHNGPHPGRPKQRSSAGECAQTDNVSVQHSQMDNEHHLLIESQAGGHQQRHAPNDTYFERPRHQQHQQAVVYDENEEETLNVVDKAKTKIGSNARRQAESGNGQRLGITGTRFSQRHELADDFNAINHHTGHPTNASRLARGGEPEREEEDEEEEEESETENYYNLEHNYDGHPTFQVEEEDERHNIGRTVAVAGQREQGEDMRPQVNDSEQAPNTMANAINGGTTPYGRKAHQRQSQQQMVEAASERQHLSPSCNCNLVLYPL